MLWEGNHGLKLDVMGSSVINEIVDTMSEWLIKMNNYKWN